MRQLIIRAWGWLTETNMKKLAFVGGCFAVVVAGIWTVSTYWLNQPQKPIAAINLIKEGNSFLNIGHYTEAKQSFNKALAIDPQDKIAALGLKITEVWDGKDTAGYEQNLQNLSDAYPNNAYVNLFYGKLYGAAHDLQKALPYYRAAISAEKNLAEAHFDLGVLYDQDGKKAEAKAEYEQATSLRALPKYLNNKAYFYFKQGDYEKAIDIHGKISNYPLSALELAKIYLIKGDLQQAEEQQRQALHLLDDRQLMDKIEHQDPWYFTTGNNTGLELAQLEVKKDYAHFCLSVSLYLQGKIDAAKLELKNLSGLGHIAIKNIITADLNNLLKANPDFKNQVTAYNISILSTR